MEESHDDPLGDWPARQRELLEMLRTGGKIGAVKNYRTWTGAGLKEAKDAVEELERTGSIPCPTPAPRAEPIPAMLESQIVELLRAGQKIEAIKIYRQANGTDLKAAKQQVEAIGWRHGIEPARGCAGALIAMVLGLALLVWQLV